MRLTRFGFHSALFYAALLGAFYASPYSNLFFLLVAFLTLQWALSPFWTHRNLRGLQLRVSGADPLPAGSKSELEVQARGGVSRRPRFQVELVLHLEGGTQVRSEFAVLRPGEALSIQVPEMPRGVYRVVAAEARSTYPFGLLRARVRVDAPHELVVFPRPVELVEAQTAAQALSETLGRPAALGDAMQPSGLREHRDGDDPRSVHWRASARRGTLVVREWEGSAGQGLEVVLDRRCQADELEDALEILSAVVVLARTHKEVLALHSQDLSASFGEGHRSFPEAQRFLAGADLRPAGSAAPPPVSPSIPRLPRASLAG